MLTLHHPFHAPHSEKYLNEALKEGDLAAGGRFSKCAEEVLRQRWDCEGLYLTPSCTDALEMAALISQVKPGDEVIMPSYTFVSTANAFELRQASVRFADCMSTLPNVNLETLLQHVSTRTRILVVMHYAGISVDMDPIISFCKSQRILLIEDAAHAFGSQYKGRQVGSLSDLSAFSFHATKLLSCGEGGCLVLRNPDWVDRADSVYEKGTNRKRFQELGLPRYEWVSEGSSFGMSGLQAAVLYSQLEAADVILQNRMKLWHHYEKTFKELKAREFFDMPEVPDYATINGSPYFIILRDAATRDSLIRFLREHAIETAFHYLSLHRSPYYANKHHQQLPNADRFERCLLRFPIHDLVSPADIERIAELLEYFFRREDKLIH